MSELSWIESLNFFYLSDKRTGIIRWGFHKDLWDRINNTEIFKKLKNMDDQIKGAKRILECRPVCKPL